MVIRYAHEADIPGILSLLGQVGEVHHRIRPDIFPANTLKYDADALKNLLQEKNRPIFIAEMDGQVAGYCFCIHKVFPESPSSVARTELYIDDLCVDESRRGQHIGTILYNHALAYATEIGCNFLTLNVWCGNDGAQKFYENAGMTPRSITMEKKKEAAQ